MQWLHIDVSGLAGNPGSSRDISASGTIPDLVVGMGRVEEADRVNFDLSLRGRYDGIAASGRAWGTFHLICSRCLVEYAEDFSVDLNERFYFSAEVAEEKDGYEIENQTVDLEPMLRDAIVLSIPITPVHDEDCRGLCTVCGADLNSGTCEHGERAVDLRWAPLRNLLADEL